MSAGRRTHRQLAAMMEAQGFHLDTGRTPWVDPLTGLTIGQEADAERRYRGDDDDLEAQIFWAQESTRFYAPGPSHPDTGVIG